ncbi:pyridoxal phosphate-dependent aminotransferase family protein [Candidatus Aminicenantes bacterium AC-335-A11]|nr:pyridoxal phosphate-dependent aminotransferase family protein [SCandidatus Aminicenantes bacterium Aminicenantia_JdfR_composite]MCP2596629.1 pyridoxal phosphate-dependent aminotransferase family protein [Candidatus Aminicenantes bacterium AC-335-G13]MCP2598045.1 pyridoxal phosphate-dependent aminotransferase family protein [Candidatus Aminicenantes bacterium AC-335-L06]MCP2618371.1 pyridoxal phosphate-dependent aminotransferase family protein [Candidatus Aminicenantes bacterium AC-335-A11]
MGVYPFFIPLNETEGTEVVIGNKRLIMIGSNNYLGLTTHPKVREAAIEAIKKYGTSCTGSRFLNGTLEMHLELEERLAKFVGKEKALVFSTGFQTNLGTISCILDKEDVVITDKEVHASIVDGVRMSKAEKRYFKHNDTKDLEKILQSYPKEKGKLVIVDGVFSMGGDIAPLPEIIPLCKKYGARLMVDDAHSVGVLGGGRGTAFHFNCVDDVDLIMGTFSKSFASVGGFIAGDKETIHWIQHFARPLIFSASLPAPNVAAVLAALDVIEEEPERVVRVNKISEMMRRELRAIGYNVGNSQTPIIPIIIGDQLKTMQAWKILFEAGIYTNVALPPAVPPNMSLLRTSYMATHTDEQLEKVLETFKHIKQKLAID